MKANIKKNDQVKVIAGKEKGKTGRVVRVNSEKSQVVVEKTNMIKRHTKPSRTGQGGIVEKEAPLHLSKVMLMCAKCSQPTRVARKVLEDGQRVRACKKCGEQLDG
jgi:large subunit ribosomal protein L24